MLNNLANERQGIRPEISKHLMELRGVEWGYKGDRPHLAHKEGGQKGDHLNVGVVFSGGPAAGGANVIVGLFDALESLYSKFSLIGFLGGPAGIIQCKTKVLTKKEVEGERNQGGFHLLGTGRTKIETPEQFQSVLETIQKLKLDGLVFIGGDDTNSNAYHLAEFLKKHGSDCRIIGIPKTIDGDLKSDEIEISFGFDTACKVYSEMIGNICMDAISSLKYWHFIKLMGRKASHVTLECALQTRPNLAFIGEEIEEEAWSLQDVVTTFVDTIEERAAKGKSYGVALIPEGLIEFIPEVKEFIKECNRLLAKGEGIEKLSAHSRSLFEKFPEELQKQFLEDRDPHGNVQVSKIETEKLLSYLASQELKKRGSKVAFNPTHHFFGYEGRCSMPSLFDANYCYNLGLTAATLIRDRITAVMAGIKNLSKAVPDWEPIAVPLTSMMVLEERKGKEQLVVEKALVDLEKPPFEEFAKNRGSWRLEDAYLSPGPMQFFGSTAHRITKTLQLESFKTLQLES